jgi:hypothetical protein
MNSNQPPIKHLNKESIRQQHSVGNMESNLNKEKGREREKEMDVYIFYLLRRQHRSFGGEEEGPQHTAPKLWILQDHEQQAATHEQDNPGKGGAKERGPPQLLWRSRAPQLDHHSSLSSLFSHTVTHVGAPR